MALPECFYRIPKYATVLVSHKDMKAIMRTTSGLVSACGRIWKICAKRCEHGQFVLSLQVAR
jgi:hypothetical protein